MAEAKNLLGKPETRRFLMDFVKRRVPEAHVDDVVQTVLISALESPSTPATEVELRRWLTGVAKHKIADQHRKSGREQPAELPDIEASPAPVEERSLARWAEGRATASKDAARTLEWMAREGEGEKLEQIAVEENVEPAAVRQRVSRMRRWMKEQWAIELALVAALALVGVMVWQTLRKSSSETPRAETPEEQARDIRKGALRACEERAFEECMRGLDRARELDPEGDRAPEVQGARRAAGEALGISPSSSAPPWTSAPRPQSSLAPVQIDPNQEKRQEKVPVAPNSAAPPVSSMNAPPTPQSTTQQAPTPSLAPAPTTNLNNGPPTTNTSNGPPIQTPTTTAPKPPPMQTPQQVKPQPQSPPPQTQQAPQYPTKSGKPQ